MCTLYTSVATRLVTLSTIIDNALSLAVPDGVAITVLSYNTDEDYPTTIFFADQSFEASDATHTKKKKKKTVSAEVNPL